MRKIRNITRDERLNFRKLLPLFLLIFATLSPLRVARAGIIQDVINGLIDGFHAGACLIDVGEEYCKADLVYFPRGNYDRNFTVSSHIEDNIKMEKKKIFFGVWTYYVGKGKVEYKTTRFDLNNSDGKPVAKIHAYAIPTPSFLVMESWKNESGTAGFTEEVSPYTSNFSAKDCKMQTGNNSCVATVTIKVPNSFKKDMVLKTEDGKVIEMQRDGILNYLNIFVKRFVGYVILEADLTPELKTYILGLAGVTSFLGMSKQQKDPTALPQDEVDRLLGIADPDRDFKTFSYLPGDMVRVISGPFTDFEGIVQKTADEGNKLVIDVTVFGRRTPVELSGSQVEQIKK